MTRRDTFASATLIAPREAGQAVTGRSADIRKRPDPHNLESAHPDPACAARVAGGQKLPAAFVVPDYGIERPEWRSSYHAGKEWYSDLRALIECTNPDKLGGGSARIGASGNLHGGDYA